MTQLLETLAEHAQRLPGACAVAELGGMKFGYSDLANGVRSQGRALSSDLDPNRPVALQLENGVDQCLLELALLEVSIPVLSLPTFFTAQQREHALASCGAQALYTGFHDVTRLDLPKVELPGGTARITFTSGSTGAPKGLCLSAKHLLTVASSVVANVGAEHAGRHLAVLPSGILLETVAGFFSTLLAGGTYVCAPQAQIGLADPFRPDFATMLKVIQEHRITSLILVPEYLAGLVGAMEATGVRLPLLSIVAVGGARTAPQLIARARALGLPLRQGYGLTECGSVAALQAANGDADGSVGGPLPHMSAQVADDGEILLDGQLCLGPIGGSPPEHPLRTGDVGRIDDAGRLWVDGRKSALLVTSFGRNVSPEWIEEALLAQPAIAQAMVWGDGLPRPRAFLVPAHPAADLAAAISAANATLPTYGQIESWREVAHFTPANGLLTGNGRLRRQAILARWEHAAFFDELEAATVRERLAFLGIPQVRAGLSGTITRRAYTDYLGQAYHHVSHTVPLMREARRRLGARPELIAALDDYIGEETGHEKWILSDIAAAGADARAAELSQPHTATKAMVDHAYRTIREGNPAAFFGMVYVLESVSAALATRGASAVAANLGLGPDAFTYLTSHGDLDHDHLKFFADLVNSQTTEDDQAAIIAMARAMFGLFGAVFGAIELDDQRAAA